MFPLLLRCICRYLLANMLTTVASVKHCFKALGVCEIFATFFSLGRIRDLVSVYMVLFSCTNKFIGDGFEYAECYL